MGKTFNTISSKVVIGSFAMLSLMVIITQNDHIYAYADSVEASIPTGNLTHFISVNPHTDKIWASTIDLQTKTSQVVIIDGSSNTIVDRTENGNRDNMGIGANPNTDRIYVSTGTRVDIFDDTTDQPIGNISLPNSYDVKVNPLTNMIYVSGEGTIASSSNVVYVINGSTNTVVATIPVGTDPVGEAVNPVTNKIYVANISSNTVSVIDGYTNTVISTITVGSEPIAVAVNPNTNTVYVSNEGGGVSVINGTTNTVTNTIQVGYPLGIAVNPNTNKIYVGDENTGSIFVINGDTNTVMSTLNIASLSIAIDPQTDKIYAGEGSMYVIDGNSGSTTSSPPQNLQAAASNGEIILSWSLPSSNGGVPVTNYKIYRGATSGGEVLLAEVNNATSYNDTSVTDGQTYFYRVTALNSVGESSPSNEISATPSAPLIQTNFTLTVNSQDSYGNTLPGFYTELYAQNGTQLDTGYTPYNFTLDNGQNYTVHVEDYGKYKFNHWADTNSTDANRTMSVSSDESMTAIYATIPAHPSNLAANAASSSEIDLTWSTPSSDGGSPITGYRIQMSTDDSSWTTIVKNTGNTNTVYSDTGLQPNTEYYYRVFALNSVGSSYRSNIASATTPILTVENTNIGPLTATLP